MRGFRRFRLRFQDLAFRIVLAMPLLLWAVGVLHFASEEGVRERPLAEAHAVTPFGSDAAGAPVIIAARVVCSFANSDAAAASINEFDGATSVVAGDKSFWLFGDSWLTRKRGGLLFANATAGKSTDTDASDCISLTYKASNGIAEPLFAVGEDESTAWPDGAVSLDPNSVDFYFASVKRTSSTKWDVTAIGLGSFDTATMNAKRLAERLWDADSGFGDSIRGARSPLLQDGEVYVFLHTTTNRLLLARVPASSMTSAEAYSYWDGSGWSSSPADAESLWPELAGDLPSHNGLSVRYDDFLGKWLAVYDRNLNTVSVRVSDSLMGPWSSEVQWLDCKTLFPTAVWPPCYYAEQHAELARDGGRTIYVTISSAPPYDVYLLELRLGAAIHQWRDSEGQIAYSAVSPGESWVDEGVKFYAGDIDAPGFSAVHLWTTSQGERVYSPQKPAAAFNDEGVAFHAPASASVAGSIVPYIPVYRWDSGSHHLYSTASAGLEEKGFVRGNVAFYAVCGDSDNNGVVDCLQ